MKISIVTLALIALFSSCSREVPETSGITIDTENVLTAYVTFDDGTSPDLFTVSATPLIYTSNDKRDAFTLDTASTITQKDLSHLTLQQIGLNDSDTYFISIAATQTTPVAIARKTSDALLYTHVSWLKKVTKSDLSYLFNSQKISLKATTIVEGTITGISGETPLQVGINGTNIFTTVDSSGNYHFDNLPEGEHDIIVVDPTQETFSTQPILYKEVITIEAHTVHTVAPILNEQVFKDALNNISSRSEFSSALYVLSSESFIDQTTSSNTTLNNSSSEYPGSLSSSDFEHDESSEDDDEFEEEEELLEHESDLELQ